MHKKQRQRMIDRHRSSLNQHGYSSDALFWSSRGIQKTRFKVLAEIGIHPGDSLLDVGCGFGDLFSWLRSQQLSTDYTGLDLSQEILDKGMKLNPQLRLLHGEIFDFDWPIQSFDWILLSGTLNWNLDDDGAYAKRVIIRMFELCRHGVAFNMLDIRKLNITPMGDLFAYDPNVILDFCQSLSCDCQLRSGYLDNDFTIYMKRP